MWCRWLIGLVSTLRSAGTQARIATVFDNDHLERAADEAQAGLGRSASARAGAEFSELIKQSHHTFGISAAVNTYLDGVCNHSTHMLLLIVSILPLAIGVGLGRRQGRAAAVWL